MKFLNITEESPTKKRGAGLRRGVVRGFPVKRDQLLLFAVTCDCKKLKAVNCEGHASRDM